MQIKKLSRIGVGEGILMEEYEGYVTNEEYEGL